MSDKLVTELVELSSGVDMSNDMLVINDASDPTELKKMTPSTLAAAFATWEQTLTNKTLTSPVINTEVSGTAIDTDVTLTGNSDTKLPSQKAVKTYVDTKADTKADLSEFTTGWRAVSAAWSYASATTITVPSGAASLYQKGDKIKLTANSVVLYAYIVSVADTVLTVLGNSLTNHAFSSIYVSRAENPFGFPTVFSYTPTLTSNGTQPVLGSSTISGKFWMKGPVCWYTGKLDVTTGGSWSAGTGTYRFGLPVTASSQVYRGQGTAFDNGTADYPQFAEVQASTAYCILVQASNGNNVGATTPMTPATGDYYVWTGFFDF